MAAPASVISAVLFLSDDIYFRLRDILYGGRCRRAMGATIPTGFDTRCYRDISYLEYLRLMILMT